MRRDNSTSCWAVSRPPSTNCSVKVTVVFFLEGEPVAVKGGAARADRGMRRSLVGAKCMYSAHSLVADPTGGFGEHEVGAFYTVCHCPLSPGPAAEALEPRELQGHSSGKGLQEVKNWVLSSAPHQMCWASLGELLSCSELRGDQSQAELP